MTVVERAFAPENPGRDATGLAVAEHPLNRRGPRFEVWSRRYLGGLVAADAVIGGVSTFTATTFALNTDHHDELPSWIMLTALAVLIWPVMIALGRGYQRHHIGVGSEEMQAAVRAGVGVVLLWACYAELRHVHGLLAFLLVATPIAIGLTVIIRFAARKILHRSQRAGRNVKTALLVGHTGAVHSLAEVLQREAHAGLQMVGVCVPAEEVQLARELGLPVVGDLEAASRLAREFECDAVAVTTGEQSGREYLRRLAWSLEGEHIELLVHPGLVEVAGPRMHIRPHVGLPLLQIEQPHFTGWRRIVKRAADLIMTGVGLVIISPLMLAIAIAIKVSDRGPVFFKQTRVGLEGSTFTMWKFRTMHVDAEERLAALRAEHPEVGLMFKLQDDPRVTRVGRFLR
ncbi:MAG TPA: sugar transferase, partial [Microlunatus sp.]|nr:sugar transferase [Microlunatus sp.]